MQFITLSIPVSHRCLRRVHENQKLAHSSQELLSFLNEFISSERGLLHSVEMPATPEIQIFKVTQNR
jgi:hypothetical protein